jgi:hypothetical protein
MFPRTDAFEPEETLVILKLKYDPQLHFNSFINGCFRSHKTKLIDTYEKFNQLAHLELKEPAISNFYSNDCFVNLYDLGNYLEGKTEKYSSLVMDQIPKNLKKLLDCIFL